MAGLIAENEQLKAELECARGDLKTAMEIVERNQKDADRYRFASEGRSRGNADICIVEMNWVTGDSVILCNEIADKSIDSRMQERT